MQVMGMGLGGWWDLFVYPIVQRISIFFIQNRLFLSFILSHSDMFHSVSTDILTDKIIF